MMFGYAGDLAWWQAWLMWSAMTAFWGLLIWAICSLITGTTRRPGPGPGTVSTAAATGGASWTSARPAARSTPMRAGGSAMSFLRRRRLPCGQRARPMTAVAADTVRA